MPKGEGHPASVVLDTHAWVWVCGGDKRCGFLAGYEGRCTLPVIALWEVSMLAVKGRLELKPSVAEWIEDNTRAPVFIQPLTIAIATLSARLKDFHGDPADRVIVATALRAGLPLAYSSGFHPHPQITLPPAIPLGYEAEDEPLELGLTAGMEAEQVRRMLNAASPDGLQFVSARAERPDGPSFSARMIAADYGLVLPVGLFPSEACAGALAAFHSRPDFVITKKTKRGSRTIDLKQSLHLSVFEPTAVQMLISLSPEKYVDPLMALSAIMGRETRLGDCVRVTRKRILE